MDWAWICLAKGVPVNALPSFIMPRPSRYSPAEKAAIVAAARLRIRQGESCKDIAQRLGVNQPSLRGWLRESTLDMLYPPLPPCMPRNRSA